MARLNPIAAVVVAASYGIDRVRADGYQVDAEAFKQAVAAIAGLARVSELSSMDTARKMPQHDHMTAQAVAAQKGITPAGVRLAAREGRLDGHRVDGRWTFDPADVESWSPR